MKGAPCMPRVETGVVRFGDDWPGLFIRGDNAFAYARYLEEVLKHVEGTSALALANVRDLLALLGSTREGTTDDVRELAAPEGTPS